MSSTWGLLGFTLYENPDFVDFDKWRKEDLARFDAMISGFTADLSAVAIMLNAEYSANKDAVSGAWTEILTKGVETFVTKVSTPTATGWTITINAPSYGLSKTMTYTKDINNNWNLQVVNN